MSGSVLVVSAHAADFVWRAAGAIALRTRCGDRVRIVCLSYGERGESQEIWKQPAMTVERVKQIRREEAEEAAAALGAEIAFFDCGDYPIEPGESTIPRLVAEFRELQPETVLAHSPHDPYNPDHPAAHELTMRSRVYAQAAGYPAPGRQLGAPPVFYFEPHQPEQCRFNPQVLLDITSVFDAKMKAIEAIRTQKHMWDYYADLARRRGVQAVRNSGNKEIKYAEAYERAYPQVASDLS
ncbi:MAG: PIG-L family deacetylase [Acidobacteriia bacterium]|nr:PIG-L family deacetylase [Terriglobia bacterium]